MASVYLSPALACALINILVFVSSGERVDIEDPLEDLASGLEVQEKLVKQTSISEEEWFTSLNLPDLAKESGHVKPLLWVPGLASVNLDFRVTPDWMEKVPFGDQSKLPTVCRLFPGLTSGHVMGLYINIPVLLKMGCWIYSMKLTYGDGPTGSLRQDDSEMCGRDNPGVEVFPETGFEAARSVGGVTVAGDLFTALQRAGYDNKSLQVMEFDWRKWSLPCYNVKLFAQFKERVEKMYTEQGNRPVIIAAHSMGAPIAHRFLSSMTAVWKQKYVRHFASIAGPLAGAPLVMNYFFDGPRELLAGIKIPGGADEALRAALNSWAGFLSLFPSTYGGAFSEDDVFITIAETNYTIKSVVDGSIFKDAVAATVAEGLSSANQVPHQTAQGCTCETGCNFDATPFPVGGFRPWCFTGPHCGRIRFGISRWDYCTVPGTTFNPAGDEALHHHVSSWVQNYHEPLVTAPNVPTTCFAVNNKDTRFSWKYTSPGSTQGVFTRVVPGDGTVPAASSTKPCTAWKAAQVPPVNIIETALGAHEDYKSDAHKGMLKESEWLKWFFELLNTV
eukprot:TRINITY_DN8472_c0_g2_i1.p1 TRINITY_DN8472_c0_g2~~TRINITY_DN8472_c0_g2_i1.p1  ORF type:complete len:594 (-),score=48.94 TRINITY_DN8472_c0_g2_i1:103-1785(-)